MTELRFGVLSTQS